MKKQFTVHTPNLLKEIVQNDQTAIFKIPIAAFSNLLELVSQRASELNDHILNNLMCKLTLYSIADPECSDYNLEKLREIEKMSGAVSSSAEELELWKQRVKDKQEDYQYLLDKLKDIQNKDQK